MKDGNTVIKWADGSVNVPENTIVFGGYQSNQYETTNITMNNGRILQIFAAGWGGDKSGMEKVKNATITINGGTVLDSVSGGGAIYSEVDNSSIIINNGNVKEIYGGGFESFVVDNIRYDAGSEDDLQGSGNRVNNVNITINNIKMPPEGIEEGAIYGGGCDYAYVGKTSITINGGDMSKASIVAGGENGYVEESNVAINGGTINSYQSLKKGLVESVTTKVMSGNIKNFYQGAEKDEQVKNKKVNEVITFLLEGNIDNLLPGINNGVPLQIDKQKYVVYITDNINIKDSSIKSTDLAELTYKILVSPTSLVLEPKTSKQINVTVTTEPEGYEDIFKGMINFETKYAEIATVSNDGVVTGVKLGKTEIIVTFLEDLEIVEVDVTSQRIENAIILILIVYIVIIFLTIIYILK